MESNCFKIAQIFACMIMLTDMQYWDDSWKSFAERLEKLNDLWFGMKKLDFSCQKKAFYNYLLFGPYYSNIQIIFSHQNLTEYWIEYLEYSDNIWSSKSDLLSNQIFGTQLFEYSNNLNYLFKLCSVCYRA